MYTTILWKFLNSRFSKGSLSDYKVWLTLYFTKKQLLFSEYIFSNCASNIIKTHMYFCHTPYQQQGTPLSSCFNIYKQVTAVLNSLEVSSLVLGYQINIHPLCGGTECKWQFRAVILEDKYQVEKWCFPLCHFAMLIFRYGIAKCIWNLNCHNTRVWSFSTFSIRCLKICTIIMHFKAVNSTKALSNFIIHT